MASLSSLPRSYLLPDSEATSLRSAIAGRGTWCPQHPGMQESIWEEGREKSCSEGEPPPAADSTGMNACALAGDCLPPGRQRTD